MFMQMRGVGRWRHALALANKERVREEGAQFVQGLTNRRRRDIQYFCRVDDAFMDVNSFKNSE